VTTRSAIVVRILPGGRKVILTVEVYREATYGDIGDTSGSIGVVEEVSIAGQVRRLVCKMIVHLEDSAVAFKD